MLCSKDLKEMYKELKETVFEPLPDYAVGVTDFEEFLHKDLTDGSKDMKRGNNNED